jgi:hypothetical protein
MATQPCLQGCGSSDNLLLAQARLQREKVGVSPLCTESLPARFGPNAQVDCVRRENIRCLVQLALLDSHWFACAGQTPLWRASASECTTRV